MTTDAGLDAEDDARNARLAAPGALPAAAHWYATVAGIAVFPCQPRGKRPLTAHGFHEATVDLEVIARWWLRWPDANIGTPCGVLFDVVDLDGPAGVKAFIPYVEAVRAACIGIVSTPRPGGMHYYLPPDPARRNSAALLPNVDVKTTGGYVILPPSITDTYGPGRRYVWLKPLAAP